MVQVLMFKIQSLLVQKSIENLFFQFSCGLLVYKSYYIPIDENLITH